MFRQNFHIYIFGSILSTMCVVGVLVSLGSWDRGGGNPVGILLEQEGKSRACACIQKTLRE